MAEWVAHCAEIAPRVALDLAFELGPRIQRTLDRGPDIVNDEVKVHGRPVATVSPKGRRPG